MVRESSPTRIRDAMSLVRTPKERAGARVAEAMLALTTPSRGSIITKGTRVERGDMVIEFQRAPERVYSHSGDVIGIDALVRVYELDGTERKVTAHREVCPPPLLVPDGTFRTQESPLTPGFFVSVPNYREDPREAYFVWLAESIRETPHAAGWER